MRINATAVNFCVCLLMKEQLIAGALKGHWHLFLSLTLSSSEKIGCVDSHCSSPCPHNSLRTSLAIKIFQLSDNSCMIWTGWYRGCCE
jgi:hypothetical protein